MLNMFNMRLIKLFCSLIFFLLLFCFLSVNESFANNYSLSGTVKDNFGNDLNGSEIHMYIQGTETDVINPVINNSYYSFDSIPEGSYDIKVIPPNNTSFTPATVLNYSFFKNTTLNFILVPAGQVSISGHIYGPLGNPLEHQWVNARASDGNQTTPVYTDQDGYFSFQVSPGNYSLLVFGSNNDSSTNTPQSYILDIPQSFTTSTVLDITVPAKKVTIHVQDSFNQPVGGVQIFAGSGGTTNADFGNGINGIAHSNYTTNNSTDPTTGDIVLWLVPGENAYGFTAIPPASSVYSNFFLPGITISDNQTQIISLQYNHHQPITTVSLYPFPDYNLNYPDPTTVTLSPVADTGYTITDTYYEIDGGFQQEYSAPFTVTGPGTHAITYWSVDNSGVSENHKTIIFIIVVANHAPVIDTFTAPTSPTLINSGVNINATFTDANTSDTHTAVWSWGDNTTSNGIITENNGVGTASGTHTYTIAGVFTVNLTITDNNNASDSENYQYIVVYDPNAGFMTVSGKYDSLAGWNMQNTQAAGKVKLGIQGKYKNNNISPTGKAKLNFKVGNFEFESTSYQWLVINSYKGYLMGTGTVNGIGNYSIFIYVIDGNVAGSGGHDLLRIRITDNSTQNIIYDTQPNTSLLADPTTLLNSGSIKIH